MRGSWRWFLLFLVATHLACGTVASRRAPVRFTILQLNDIYRIEGVEGGTRGGLARVRTLRRQLESEGDRVLVMHAGDFLFPSVMSKHLRARPMVETMNLLDGDPIRSDPDLIVTLGNHEFDDRDPDVLLSRIAESRFLWVSSNTHYCSSTASCTETFAQKVSNMRDTTIIEIGGYRVGVFGLTVDNGARDWVKVDYALPLRRAAIRKAIDSLRRQRADVIIALTHQDLAEDERLAREFPEVGLVIGGHDHTFLQRRVGETWITKGDADAQSVVVHDVTLSGRRTMVSRPRRVVLDSSVVADPEIERSVQYWIGELANVMKNPLEVIGTTAVMLEGLEPVVRGRESALGNLLADVARTKMSAEIGLVNGGSIRINDNIPPGPVRRYDLEGVFYFDNGLVSFDLTGAELLSLLEASVARAGEGDGRFLQVSGLRFAYRPSAAIGARVGGEDVEVMNRQGTFERLEPERTYRIATLDYLWKNGHREGMAIFSDGAGGKSPERTDGGKYVDFRKAAEEFIAALPGRLITTGMEGRIREIGE